MTQLLKIAQEDFRKGWKGLIDAFPTHDQATLRLPNCLLLPLAMRRSGGTHYDGGVDRASSKSSKQYAISNPFNCLLLTSHLQRSGQPNSSSTHHVVLMSSKHFAHRRGA